jgi:hypothetical protein
MATDHQQTPKKQILLVQSLGDMQARPLAHFAHEPPQSTSVSLPFFTPSVHVPAHGGHTLPPQSTPVSLPFFAPSVHVPAHGGHTLPPQSTPVSLPFFTPSVHTGALHENEMQTPL